MAKKKILKRGKRGLKPTRGVPDLGLPRQGGDLKSLLSEILSEPPVETKPVVASKEKLALSLEAPPSKFENVIDSYGQVEIVSIAGETLPMYRLKLPELSKQEIKLVGIVKKKAIEEIKVDPTKISDPIERQRVFTHEVLKILEREGREMHLSSDRLKHLGEIAVRDMIGYGLLDYMLADDQLEDIMVTGIGKPVYVYHRKHGMCFTNVVFGDEDSIRQIIDKMARLVGRRIDQQAPLLDARLPDGSRINATLPPVTLEGPTLSVRKFRKDPLTVIDILNFGTMSTDVAAFLWLVVDGLNIKPANILFAGGTGCGKTTTLNAATTFVPSRERIISIEDTAELQLPHRHWIRMETRPPNIEGKGEITMDDLVKNALRMRPDRLIVGEVRGPEARTMFTAMNTGHEGCMGTIHSNSAMETIIRLTEAPMNVPEIMIPALDIIVMQQRIYHRQKGQIRRVTEVAEITGLEGGRPQLSRIFKWNPRTDIVEATGVPSKIKRTIAEFSGLSGGDIEIEIEKRATVLEWMKKKGIRSVFDVGAVIQEYYRDPEAIMKKIRGEKSHK
jgi:flagellar protein FlaI